MYLYDIVNNGVVYMPVIVSGSSTRREGMIPEVVGLREGSVHTKSLLRHVFVYTLRGLSVFELTCLRATLM